MTEEFDPNKIKNYVDTSHTFKYALHCKYGYPKFRVYEKVGTLKRGVSHYGPPESHYNYHPADKQQELVLYGRNTDGTWKQVGTYIPPKNCEYCNETFMTEKTYTGWNGQEFKMKTRIVHVLDKSKMKPKFRKPRVCESCWNEYFKPDAPQPTAHDVIGPSNYETIEFI